MSYSLRAATPLDAGQIGIILHRFEQETTWMPKDHSSAQVIGFCDRMIARGWVSVAQHDARRQILGFMAQDGAEICSLYLAPEACGQGIGKALLERAKAASPHLYLWTFQANTGAQRFYLREGFVEAQRSTGERNDEGLPDIEYHWHAKRPNMGQSTRQINGLARNEAHR